MGDTSPTTEDNDPNITDIFRWSETTPAVPGTNVLSSKEKEAIAVIAFIMVCTLVGNSILILLLLCKHSRRIKRVNVFLVNLAIVDIAVALITNTTEIIFVAFGDWTLGPVVCKLSVYLQIVTLACATFLLTAMSIDRYQVIVKPMQSLRNRPRIWFKVLVAWIAAFVFAVPQLFIFVQVEKGVKFDGTPKRLCLSKGYTEEWQRKVYMTFMTTYILLIPASVMLFCYSNIIAVVWTRAVSDEYPSSKTCSLYGKVNTTKIKPRAGCAQPDVPRVSIRRGLVTASKRRAIVMTLTVIIGFLVCLTPYFIVTLVRIYSNYKLKLKVALTVSENIFMTHSALNPLLYGFFTLRPKQLKRLCRCLRCNRTHSEKSTEKNRLINGVAIRQSRKEKSHFQSLSIPNSLPPPGQTKDLVTENTHALVLLNRANCPSSTIDGCTKSMDIMKPLYTEARGKYDTPEVWLSNRKMINDECLSKV